MNFHPETQNEAANAACSASRSL